MTKATDQQDRGRYLRELAQLAKTPPPPKAASSARPLEGMPSADSSGYVDLAALLATDPDWIDRELARKQAPTLAPVARSAFAAPDDTGKQRAQRGGRGKWLVGGGMMMACVAVLGVAIGVRALRTRGANVSADHAVAAQPAPPPATPLAPQAPVNVAKPAAAPVADPDAEPRAGLAAPPGPAAQTTQALAGATPKGIATPAGPKPGVAFGAAAAPVHAPAAVAAAAPKPAAAAPAPQAAGADPLLDAIKRSMGSKKPKH